jgi:hypothetical protein
MQSGRYVTLILGAAGSSQQLVDIYETRGHKFPEMIIFKEVYRNRLCQCYKTLLLHLLHSFISFHNMFRPLMLSTFRSFAYKTRREI